VAGTVLNSWKNGRQRVVAYAAQVKDFGGIDFTPVPNRNKKEARYA